MKFRELRGGLRESLETLVELPDRAALIAHVSQLQAAQPFNAPVSDATVHVRRYYHDPRTGWDTHLVTLDIWGPVGYTDGPCEAEE
jgi:hypothetical protein